METNLLQQDIQKVMNFLEEQLSGLQLGKANPKLVENIEIYIPSRGSTTKISTVATVSTMDAQTIKIEPREKGQNSSINKGILDANIGFTPQDMGSYIMIKIPPMTTDRRKDLAKLVSRYGEESKISIRNIRHEYMQENKKMLDNKEIGENDKKARDKQIDDLVKDTNNLVDKYCKIKTEEIMTI